jgi:hypothetical protein
MAEPFLPLFLSVSPFSSPFASHVPDDPLVLTSNTTPTGGTLTVHAIAYLKRNVPTRQPYRFAGK